ncbi:AAA family ATPase [Desulfovibrio sp. JC010]|uniref:AAA family ATPase n=1 Tax=Desulfovibrio sp. JC010 TaxID=2593641 RepID=UPI0013D0A51E|nr:ATP-binding protein [Desulfovibrio sp. JC010]NDV26051.1 AAA family ATPase [Desulfovibrio sp. JC010]
MITKIRVYNFKSLHGTAKGHYDFELELGKFNCLVGLNGSGKSTILQFFDFLTVLIKGNVSEWFNSRAWTEKEINFQGRIEGKLNQERNILIQIRTIQNDAIVTWTAAFNRTNKRCSAESFLYNGEKILDVNKNKLTIYDEITSINHEYEGSIVATLQNKILPDAVFEFKKTIEGIKSLDLLSPNLLRKKSRYESVDIGHGGESINAFLHSRSADETESIIQTMKSLYPNFSGYNTKALKGGWKKLSITELHEKEAIDFDSKHASDGLLRLLAIIAEAQSEHSFLLLDEIENGIHPELIEKLVNIIARDVKAQTLVTTHNPLILNYLTDEEAQESVSLIYKTKEGFTRAKNFFEIPSVAEKLDILGPGEVYVDTNLEELTKSLHTEESV